MDNVFKLGNTKLYKNILIFNMGSATNCPSRLLGLCKNKDICYAYKAEYLYKNVKSYRNKQSLYWKNTDYRTILKDIESFIKNRKIKIKYFRYNESGDFYNQEDVNKLHYIAKSLKDRYGIITYGYTARCDLKFLNVSFIVLGSNFMCNNGETFVIDIKDKKKRMEVYSQISIRNKCLAQVDKNVKCGNGCIKCMSSNKKTLYFLKH